MSATGEQGDATEAVHDLEEPRSSRIVRGAMKRVGKWTGHFFQQLVTEPTLNSCDEEEVSRSTTDADFLAELAVIEKRIEALENMGIARLKRRNRRNTERPGCAQREVGSRPGSLFTTTSFRLQGYDTLSPRRTQGPLENKMENSYRKSALEYPNSPRRRYDSLKFDPSDVRTHDGQSSASMGDRDVSFSRATRVAESSKPHVPGDQKTEFYSEAGAKSPKRRPASLMMSSDGLLSPDITSQQNKSPNSKSSFSFFGESGDMVSPRSPSSFSLSALGRTVTIVDDYGLEDLAEHRQANRFFSVLAIWFIVVVLLAIIAVVLTTIEFIGEVDRPLSQLEIVPLKEAKLPIVTICPIDRGLPYFPGHTVLAPFKQIYDLAGIRLPDGTSCSKREADFDDCINKHVEQGWVTIDPAVNCGREYQSFSVSNFSSDDFLNLPCKYCFRVGSKESSKHLVERGYLHDTSQLKVQVSPEYSQCILNPGGLVPETLGSGSTVGTLNYLMKTRWRRFLIDLRILDFGTWELSDSDNADFDSKMMCNILFFSGAFFPTDKTSEIKYQWDGMRWMEVGDGPYFKLRDGISIMFSLGFEVYFEHPDDALSFDRVAEGEGQINEVVAQHADKHMTNRHLISPAQRPIRAPLVLVGGFSSTMIVLKSQNLYGRAFYSWSASSHSAEESLEAEYSGIIEYGFENLTEETLSYRRNSDRWAWIENCLGWVGSFTGLSIFSLVKRKIRLRTSRSSSEGGHS